MRTVEIVPYQKKWKSMFKEEREKLKDVFKDEAIDIHHIGSTAIEHLDAKPIIDLLIVVRDITKVDAYNNEMASLGYGAYGENGIRNRRFFAKGGDKRTHHVHIFENGDSEIRRHLAFRDYLRTHPEKAKEYGQLKRSLSNLYCLNPAEYTKGKSAFIQSIDEKARSFYQEKG